MKEWEEFRASFAAAYLLVWLTEEAGETLVDYAEDLQSRFMSGWDIQETFHHDPDEPEDSRSFPLPPVGGVQASDWERNLVWMDNSEARTLYDQLFPHSDSVQDFRRVVATMAVVVLYSAIEVYANACGIRTQRFPRAVEAWLGSKSSPRSIDSTTMRSFIDLDATRHILVHNRGIVNDRYIRQVQGTELHQGEFRSVTRHDLRTFARSAWRVAEAIRDSAEHGAFGA